MFHSFSNQVMEVQLLTLLLFLKSFDLSHSWSISPKDFLNEFAYHEHHHSTILYLPIKTTKAFELTKKLNNVKILHHENIVGKNLSNVVLNGQELHVFIPDEKNIQKSVSLFKFLYNQRNYLNSEYWLLDISYWNSITDFSKAFTGLKLDFGKF